MQGHTGQLCSSRSIPLSDALFVEKKAPPENPCSVMESMLSLN